ncbi:hypothetical protein CCR75_005719 [Bremia lactucae]|uniref:Uncharacterized protein n=1 Tax=Bremia lactucae TaxID=4779 RepID=A0A976IIH6_BRELC|nr:hypothetical protein CCR75_005719 [Bremia lactucae]
MTTHNACWWLRPWKKLDQDWQASCMKGQQLLGAVADSMQKTTYLLSESLDGFQQLPVRASTRLWELAHRCSKRLLDEVLCLANIYSQMRRLLYDKQVKSIDAKRRQRYGRTYNSNLLVIEK